MIRRVVAPRVRLPDELTGVALPGAAATPNTPRRSWSIEESFAYCEQIVRASTENFPVASRFVPAHLRPYVWAIYSFARFADNFADEPEYEGRRAEALDHWEEELERCYHGDADHPVFIALREAVDKRDIPILPLRDMLTAYRIDLHVKRHPTFASLRNYCAHAAEPIGRLILCVFGYRDPALTRFTDDLSTALQLTKVVQDVKQDLAHGYLYLPEEDLSHFGVREADLAAGFMTPRIRDLLRFQVARARSFFERGRPIVHWVDGELSFEMNLIWHSGTTILEKIEAVDYDVFQRRPAIDTLDKLKMVMRSARRSRM
jgi:squalene synthase HpnC